MSPLHFQGWLGLTPIVIRSAICKVSQTSFFNMHFVTLGKSQDFRPWCFLKCAMGTTESIVKLWKLSKQCCPLQLCYHKGIENAVAWNNPFFPFLHLGVSCRFNMDTAIGALISAGTRPAQWTSYHWNHWGWSHVWLWCSQGVTHLSCSAHTCWTMLLQRSQTPNSWGWDCI